MKATEFLSPGVKLALPTATNPKVYLAIDNSQMAKQSFKLYNPFSKKAKILKFIVEFLCVYCNPIAKKILPTRTSTNSEFIQKLKGTFNTTLHSSVYIATANDKFVLQLQSEGEIKGYVKLAISSIGKSRILNEMKAIAILSGKNLIPEVMLTGEFRKKPYIVLENLEGAIGLVDDRKFSNILETYKKNKKHKLSSHPRVTSLKEKLIHHKLNAFAEQLNSQIENSVEIYHEVYEHGDFAPWNLIEVKNKIIPFDFEYFEENGLEYLDEIKYHFQIGHLIQNKKGEKLIEYISNKVNIPEFNIVFSVYLFKEIANKNEEKETYVLENALLNLLAFKC